MLLIGATLQEIALDLIKAGLFTKGLDSAKARVQTHIFHLRNDEHKVPVKDDANGVWKFAFHPLRTGTRSTAQKIPKFLNLKPMRDVSNTPAQTKEEFDFDDIKI